MSKEELLKQYLGFSAIFNGHLEKLKSIPSQNFSSLDQKRMMTLQNGIDALKILAQKLETFSEGEDADVAVEKVAVEKAIETASELEGDQINKSQVSQSGDELIKKIFEAEDLTGMNDFKPEAGVPEGAKDMNEWTPETNSIEDMNEAFSQYVAQDYYRRITGREDFALHIGNKSISTNPKDYLRAIKHLGKKTNKNLNEVGKNLDTHYPSLAGGLKVAGKGALIGAALDIAISCLKRNLSYDEYVKNCKLEGIEPIEKSKYTIGTLEDLKKSAVRGASIGAVGNLAITGGQKAMDGLKTSLAEANFALTEQDFSDASKIAEEQSLELMRKTFSLSRGYYPGDNNQIFLDWLQENAEEYFSLRLDLYNKILEEAANFSTIGDTLKGAGVGAGIGGLSGIALAAIKQNKSYDIYKAEAEAKGEKPLSRVAYLAKSKEVHKAGLKGAGAGAGLGAALGASGLGRKGVEGIKKLLPGSKNKITGKNNVLPPTNRALEEAKNLENNVKYTGNEHIDKSEADKVLAGLNTTALREAYNKERKKGRLKNISFEQYRNFKTKQIQKQTDANTLGNLYRTGTQASKTTLGRDVVNQKKTSLANAMKQLDKGVINSKVWNTFVDKGDQDVMKKLADQLKNAKTPEEQRQALSAAKQFIGMTEGDKLRGYFFSLYGYYPQHSSDILFQNFCCGLVRDGVLQFKDLATINFNFPQHQEDFAINKATVATGIVSGIAGGVGGKLLANRKIKEEEKRLGRPLTQEERSKITKRLVIGGAAGAGLAGAGAAHGIQHAAGKGNATAQNIVNKVAGVSNNVQGVFGKGKEQVDNLKNKGERLYKKYIHGIDYQMQDAIKMTESADRVLAQEAMAELQKTGDMSKLSPQKRDALLRMNQQTREGGLARKAMIVGGAGIAYKFLAPMVQEAISRGAKVDESQVQAMVQKMQAEGKSEDEIRSAVQNYLQAAFFSYAQGFLKYY